MTVPAYAVAIAFTIAALFCVFDMFTAEKTSQKLFRFFQCVILSMAAYYYWQAEISQAIPGPHLRVVWLALCVIVCAEIISRQDWGTKNRER